MIEHQDKVVIAIKTPVNGVRQNIFGFTDRWLLHSSLKLFEDDHNIGYQASNITLMVDKKNI
jgi:hypothetical protein